MVCGLPKNRSFSCGSPQNRLFPKYPGGLRLGGQHSPGLSEIQVYVPFEIMFISKSRGFLKIIFKPARQVRPQIFVAVRIIFAGCKALSSVQKDLVYYPISLDGILIGREPRKYRDPAL